MAAIENIASRIKGVKVAKIPIGQAALLLAGLGISDVLVGSISGITKMPGLISGPALAILLQLGAVKKLVGSTMADVLAATAVAVGIDQQIALREKTSALVGRIVPGRAPLAGLKSRLSSAPRVVPSPKTSTALGQVPEELLSEQERRIISTLQVRR